MTAKEYLGQAYKIDRRINMTLAKAEKLRASLYGRSSQTESTGGQHGNSSDSLGAAIAKIVDYERKADELIDKLVDKKIEIENAIQSVKDPIQREVLERRYLLFQDWDGYYDKKTEKYIKGIYEEMHFSRRRVFQLHKIALNCIELHLKSMI